MKCNTTFSELALGCLLVVLTSCHPIAPTTPAPAAAPLAAAPCGGVHRWDVKTASDAGIQNQLNPNQTVDTTVHDLIARDEAKPWRVNMPRQVTFDATPPKQAVEKTVWKITEVLLVSFKLERDQDIHLEVMDPDPKYSSAVMTIEFPDTDCRGAFASPFKPQMAKARQDVITSCGNPPTGGAKLKGSATITGIGFFDREHRLGAETIELHPALSFMSGSCKRK